MLGQHGTIGLDDMIQLYLEDVRELLATMHTALDREDTRALRRAAHKLKSISALLRARTLASWCGELERIDHAEAANDCHLLVREIEVEFTRVKCALDQA